MELDKLITTCESLMIVTEKMTTAERNVLKDEDFGLPSQRKYPLNDKEHVLEAIKFFNYVKKEDEKELAENIIKRIHELKMEDEVNVGKNNKFIRYFNPDNKKGD